MMRKLAIGLAAASIAMGGTTLSALALHGQGSMEHYKGSHKGSLGKSVSRPHITHRFGPRTYGMEEREYGPRHRRAYERHGYEPLLSPHERERLRDRIIGRLEREPLLSPYERERLRGRMIGRLERGEPLLSPYERERLRGRIVSRLEREPLLSPYERERLRSRIGSRLDRERFEERRRYEPRLSQFERERYFYRHERPYGYRYGYERPYGYRYGHERPYGHRFGYEEYKHGSRYYGRR